MQTIFLSKEIGHVKCPSLTFFDFESTGKDPANAEILTGYFKTVDAKSRELIDELHVNMRPIKYLQESYSIHGITEERAKGFRPKKDMMRDIFRYIARNNDSLFICHANYITYGIRGYFDWQLLKSECLYMDVLHHFNEMFRNVHVYSTHTMAKDRKVPVQNYRLGTLSDYYGFKFKAHDCVEDTLATEHLFWSLIDQKDFFTLMEEV